MKFPVKYPSILAATGHCPARAARIMHWYSMDRSGERCLVENLLLLYLLCIRTKLASMLTKSAGLAAFPNWWCARKICKNACAPLTKLCFRKLSRGKLDSTLGQIYG